MHSSSHAASLAVRGVVRPPRGTASKAGQLSQQHAKATQRSDYTALHYTAHCAQQPKQQQIHEQQAAAAVQSSYFIALR